MSETVPLESVSRWSGLSPWVALLPWRMAGAASPEIKSGAGSVVHRGTGPAPTGVGEKTCATRVGLGEEGWKPAGGAGGGGSDPRAWCCLVERSARSSRRRNAATRGPSRALKRPVCPTGRQPLLALRQCQALSGQGRGQVFAKGLSLRRLRRETTLPGRQRIPRTAAISSVPPSPVGTSAAARPVPWL